MKKPVYDCKIRRNKHIYTTSLIIKELGVNMIGFHKSKMATMDFAQLYNLVNIQFLNNNKLHASESSNKC